MSTDITGLIVAVVGVAGTLTAPVVTQRLSMRARQQELDFERGQRTHEGEAERRRAEVQERKAAYLNFLVAERSQRSALRDHLFEPSEQTRDAADQARRTFDRAYAESHLIAARPVLDAVVAYGRALSAVTQRLAEIDKGAVTGPDAEREREALLSALHGEIRGRVTAVRAAMRADIGSEPGLQSRDGEPVA